MGLGKRASEPVKVILKMDSSILPGSDYDKYKENFFDESCLILDQSDKPCRFTIRQLSDEQKDIVFAMPTTRNQAKMAIRCALISVDGYSVYRPDGTVIEWHQPEYEDGGRLGRIISEKWLKELNMPADQLAELYLLIDHVSEAHLPFSKSLGRQAGRGTSTKQATG